MNEISLDEPNVFLGIGSWGVVHVMFMICPYDSLPETIMFAPEKWMVGILVSF